MTLQTTTDARLNAADSPSTPAPEMASDARARGEPDNAPLRVLLVTPYGKDGQGGIDRLNDTIVERISAQPDLHIEVRSLVSRGQRGLVYAQFVFAWALVRLSAAGLLRNVDLVHIHLSNSGSSYRKSVVGALARLLGLPYVVHLHGVNFREFWSTANPVLASALDHLFRHSVRIVVMGRYWASVITERLPEVANRIVILPNATPPADGPHIPATDGRTRITFLGQLGARKGTPQLLEALGQLAQRTDWTAIVAGDGDVEDYRERAKRLGIADRVSVPGWFDVERRNELLRSTDILVLPSFAENLPMVILEAFANGIAVVSTPVGAIPEVITDRRNGMLVPPGDVTRLASAIAALLDDTRLRTAIGAAARKDHAELYEMNTYVRRLAAIWRDIKLPRR